MRTSLAQPATEWLKNAPNPVTDPASVFACFNQAPPPQVIEFKGPHSFYRVAGRDEGRQRMADPYGCWWIDETALAQIATQISRLDQFEGWMSPEQLRLVQSMPLHYRALTAICEDWNDFREQVVMRLPPGETIVGLTGSTAPQPVRSTLDRQSRQTLWLPGGLEQVYFKRGNRGGTAGINPLWVYFEKLW
jgi:hypothetical protein